MVQFRENIFLWWYQGRCLNIHNLHTVLDCYSCLWYALAINGSINNAYHLLLLLLVRDAAEHWCQGKQPIEAQETTMLVVGHTVAYCRYFPLRLNIREQNTDQSMAADPPSLPSHVCDDSHSTLPTAQTLQWMFFSLSLTIVAQWSSLIPLPLILVKLSWL